MNSSAPTVPHACRAATLALLATLALTAHAQVTPDAVLNPKLKSDDARYLVQTQSLHQAIDQIHFPFPFRLARYPGLRTHNADARDTRGIEFVFFDHREILKVSGVYQAAFNARTLTENQRADQTFQSVALPILQLLHTHFPSALDCDGIGLEIVFHTRDATSAYDYEGQETLTVLMSLPDAFAYPTLPADQQQHILNRSSIFVNGRDFGLALGQPNPLNPQSLERSVPPSVRLASDPAPAPTRAPEAIPSHTPAAPLPSSSVEQFHAQPTLHLTLHNTLAPDPNSASIYKRAAQSFDLFLAPRLRAILAQLPPNPPYTQLRFTLIAPAAAPDTPLSDAIDFICPLAAIRSFVHDQITSQDLINQSIVLVHGTRIGLNLQMVE